MSEIVGFDLKPEPTTPLCVMIQYGLDKHLEKLAIPFVYFFVYMFDYMFVYLFVYLFV